MQIKNQLLEQEDIFLDATELMELHRAEIRFYFGKLKEKKEQYIKMIEEK